MRVPLMLRRHPREPVAPGLSGIARVDARTKNLTKRLQHGQIAVIEHLDIDKVSAEALIACHPAAVINAVASTSGRYPNLGPEILVEGGIPLIDQAGHQVMLEIEEGQVVRIDEGKIYVGDRLIAEGTVQTEETVAASTTDARAGLAVQLESFAANTMEFLRRERELLLDGVGVPDIRTDLDGRHALVVVRGYGYRRDLAALRHYIREFRPVLIAVDGGADALLEEGMRPHIIVGDMDSVSDDALRCGAEVVVHAYRDGHAPGLSHVQDLGITPVVFPAAGTSEDVALLLADEKGAQLIVAVGTHATLVEFLDKGRSGMASTFLTRLRVGGKLVDARGLIRLYHSRIPAHTLALVVVAAAITFAVAMAVTPGGVSYRELLDVRWHDFLNWLHGLFT